MANFGGATLKQSLSYAIRPSIEALLLAAVALSCAQAGWTLLTPATAGAASVTDDNDSVRFEAIEAQSPFAPEAGNVDAGSHAISALLSSIKLDGVRMSDESLRDGAMFTLGDGTQRAFLIGHEIADGVTLADVEADYVMLAYEGGQRRLEMSAGPSFSFARAMMGLEPAEGAPVMASEAVDEMAATSPATPQMSSADRAWVAATLANVEVSASGAHGWRVEEGAPEAVIAVGIRSGDLIVSINGAGPDDAASALAAMQSLQVDIEVERMGGGRFTVTLRTGERT